MTRRARRFAVSVAVAVTAAAATVPLPAAASAASAAPPPAGILSAPTLVANTADGTVGYRDVGHGSPIVLIVGSGGTMDNWDPSFVDALAARHRVIVLDNSGVGQTAALSAPLTIAKMAGQASALITALRLHRPTLLGWSMGGMIAQVVAALQPWQVGRLILAGTEPGDGHALPIPQSVLDELGSTDVATVVGLLFPPDQEAAGLAYFEDIFRYPGFYAAPPAAASAQLAATLSWIAGDEPAGHLTGRIHARTLVAGGTQDVFDPARNDVLLARGIRGARLVLYPDAGHAFLFQDAASFIPLVERFIGR
ncbi:MAG TPA: alpha/beta hydrolase [Streptosporangiaceae bacterium]|nr:alpha/beta hydrolase [Streptosporangiaceae bacterium]